VAISTLDPDTELLICELSASLTRRCAFETAARAALAAINCSGCGAAYRVLAPLQRAYWDPPPDDMRREGARHLRPSKLQNLPAVGRPDPREGGRDRHRFRVMG
jgi:hypothetical protein